MNLPKKTLKIVPDVHWVGVKDWDRRMFDRLIPLPRGTSYNSYLIQGKEANVLVDSVNPGFERELEAKIETIIDPENLDYIVMNHAEPDHSNAIPHVLSLSDGAKILTTEKGREMASKIQNIPEDKIRVVEDGETFDMGDKTLKFIDAPWLHWPETMMTFYEEEGLLFSCDYFGSHLATGKFYDEELGDDLYNHAKRYYGEIMMPFRKMGKKALEKIKDLDIEIIAPSHGPLYKETQKIVSRYKSWTEGEVEEKILVFYTSMWGSTEKLIEALLSAIESENIEATSLNLASLELGRLAEEIVDSAGIVIGSPTIHGGSHPEVHHIVHLLRKLNPPTKYIGFVESHGWAPAAVSEMREMLGGLPAEDVGAVEIEGAPLKEDLEKAVELGKEMAEKVKS